MTQAPAGASADFDFFIGNWRVAHRQLKRRLAGCTDWVQFAGSASMRPMMGGLGNVDDNVIEHPSGTYCAITMRAFDPQTGTWSIWWLDARHPGRLDPPVVGAFDNGRGNFETDDILDNKPIKVRFRWDARIADAPRWEQAFSGDDGATWETNWVMDFTRA